MSALQEQSSRVLPYTEQKQLCEDKDSVFVRTIKHDCKSNTTTSIVLIDAIILLIFRQLN